MARQRSAMFGVYSGTGCAVGGAVAGTFWAGPVGGVVAGAVALIGGSAVGDRLTSGRRRLTDFEIEYVREIFADSVDLRRVRLTRDSLVSLGAPKAVRDVIHLKSDWGHFQGDTLDLSESGLCVLVHELCHVWQYQNGGLAYIHRSLWAQYRGWRTCGSRGAAYDWLAALTAGIPWERWNPEQQATAIEDYNRALRRDQAGTPRPDDTDQLGRLQPFVDAVRRRQGAPRYFGRVSVGS